MSEFIRILTHGRRLKAAVEVLTIEQMEEVYAKMGNIIEVRREALREEEERIAERKAKLEELRKQIAEAGFSANDLVAGAPQRGLTHATIGKPRRKRKEQYEFWGADGIRHTWTGQGRMPTVIANAIKHEGKSLSDFKIPETQESQE